MWCKQEKRQQQQQQALDLNVCVYVCMYELIQRVDERLAGGICDKHYIMFIYAVLCF